MSTDLVQQRPRQLGIKVKPALRLAIGYQGDRSKGEPAIVKLNHFRAKFGAENENQKAAIKFHEVYGPEPKAISVQLPASLEQALRIQYMAWGGGGDEGGVLKAIGATNFAGSSEMGGPDHLTIWDPDGTVREGVEISGLGDQTAMELGLELYTTLRFGIPNVLGFGSWAEITSKGKETTDNLWYRLHGLYEAFGARVPFAVSPLLVVKPSTARPIIEKDGQRKRIKTKIFTLDIVVPENREEILERLTAFQSAMGTSPPSLAVEGGRVAEGVAGPEDPSPPPAPSATPDDEPLVGEVLDDPRGETLIPRGELKGQPLKMLLERDNGEQWLRWCLRNWDEDEEFKVRAWEFARAYMPEVYLQVSGEKATA